MTDPSTSASALLCMSCENGQYQPVYDKECDVAEAVRKAKEDPAEIQAVRAAAVGRQGVGRAAQERDSSRRFSVCEREREKERRKLSRCVLLK
eukprot:COSAG04_NODE_315_length_17025_cov_118.870318_3_plen_93_part_00